MQVQHELSVRRGAGYRSRWRSRGDRRVIGGGSGARPETCHEAGGFSAEVRMQQGVILAVVLAQVQLVVHLEGFDSLNQRVRGIAHLDAVGLKRRVREELAA